MSRTNPPVTVAGLVSAKPQRVSIHGGLFLLFAIELFLMGTVVWSDLINRHCFPDRAASRIDLVWGLLALAATGWGTVYLLGSRRAAMDRRIRDSRNLLMIVAGSGVLLLGVLLLQLAQAFVPSAALMDVRPQLTAPPGSTTSATPAAAVGDAANGQKWFSMSCVTCHGPTGDGVANAAPSLRASEFLKTADAPSIASLIRNGRAVSDPANKTGKVMPAKGGNPFLDESKIADLVAFLQGLHSQGASASTPNNSAIATDLSTLNSPPAGQPAPIVRHWTPDDLPSLNAAPTPESIARGMQAFVKAACQKCHMSAVAGQELGPALDQVIKKYPRDKLLSQIVQPSAEINEKFQSQKFLLVDGRTLSGVVVAASDQTVEILPDLLKPEDRIRIPVSEIDEQAKNTVSPMPDGLLDVLTAEEVQALVDYIVAAGQQLAITHAPQLNRWVVPAAADSAAPSDWTAVAAVPMKSFLDGIRQDDSRRYSMFNSWLFVMATSVLALHFLWVIGSAAAVVMYRELQLSATAQVQLANQAFLFWIVGTVWLALWFVLFFYMT